MPIYTYKAKTRDGILLSRRVEASNKEEAVKKVHQSGLYLITLKEDTHAFKGASSIKVKPADLAVFTRQLSTLYESGVTLVRAFEILAQQTDNHKFQGVLAYICVELQKGAKLSEAIRTFPEVFSSFYVNMVKTGEEGGFLPDALNRVADFLEKDAKIMQKLKAAMTYPAAVVAISIIMGYLVVTLIMPHFVELFDSLKIPLPLISRMMVLITRILTSPVAIIAVLIIIPLLTYLFKQLIITPPGRLIFDAFKLGFPVIGGIIRKIILARIAQCLATLLGSGIHTVHALDLAGKVSDNEIYNKRFNVMTSMIKEGETLAKAFGEQFDLFPNQFVQMLSAGEESGKLDSMFKKIADFYETQVDYELASVTSVIEPVLIVFTGVLVGFMIVAVFLPLYGLIAEL